MKKQTFLKIAGSAVLLLALATPAFAAVTLTKIPAVNVILDRSNTEIENRDKVLTELKTRLGDMLHVDADTKSKLSASIDADISKLSDLKVKISGETTDTARKADEKSITTDNRTYMLVVPQLRISAAADSALNVADMMTAMDVKLQTRISAANTAGKDISAITTAQTDMSAKVADAKTQANAALALVTGLKPDGGDATIMQTNTAALKSARADIVLAQKDLQAARKDLDTILKTLKGFKMTGSADAKTSTSGSNQ